MSRRSGDAAMFRFSPGDPLVSATFTGAAGRTSFDQNGVLRSAGVNVLRDGHYIGGVRTVLLESARTNSVLWSRDQSNVLWTTSSVGSAAQDAVGLDGTANSATTLTDNDGAAFYLRAQLVVVPNDAATHTCVVYVKKDTNQARFVGVVGFLSGGTAVQRTVHLNTQTGAVTTIGIVGTGTTRLFDAGLWWAIEITLTNNTTGNVGFRAELYPAVATVFGTNAAAATGSAVIGYVGYELNATAASSPIFTTTAAVPRGADALSFPALTQSGTYYERWLDATGTATEGVSVYTAGSVITPTLNRAYTSLKVAVGPRTLADMRVL